MNRDGRYLWDLPSQVHMHRREEIPHTLSQKHFSNSAACQKWQKNEVSIKKSLHLSSRPSVSMTSNICYLSLALNTVRILGGFVAIYAGLVARKRLFVKARTQDPGQLTVRGSRIPPRWPYVGPSAAVRKLLSADCQTLDAAAAKHGSSWSAEPSRGDDVTTRSSVEDESNKRSRSDWCFWFLSLLGFLFHGPLSCFALKFGCSTIDWQNKRYLICFGKIKYWSVAIQFQHFNPSGQGVSVRSLHVLLVSAWVFSRYSGFFTVQKHES